ncbi:hypothetical protein CGRA01v4_13442 [Colletotrichum graminicola]|nr:hypothetical protein CGRA01v4_13442 [Colletotrichum graminicola]
MARHGRSILRRVVPSVVNCRVSFGERRAGAHSDPAILEP